MDRVRTYGRLRERIREKFDNVDSFADAMKKSRTTISFKLNGKVPWNQCDIEQACELLDILKAEIPDYFFYD